MNLFFFQFLENEDATSVLVLCWCCAGAVLVLCWCFAGVFVSECSKRGRNLCAGVFLLVACLSCAPPLLGLGSPRERAPRCSGLNHAEVALWQDFTYCPAIGWTDYLRLLEKEAVAITRPANGPGGVLAALFWGLHGSEFCQASVQPSAAVSVKSFQNAPPQ